MIGVVLNLYISFLMPQIKLQNDVKTKTVASFVNTNGDWVLRDVERFLPTHIVEFVSYLSTLHPSNGDHNLA